MRKFADIMSKFVGVCVHCAIEISVLNHGEQQTFGEGVSTALSIDRDYDPAENLNVLRWTLVM